MRDCIIEILLTFKKDFKITTKGKLSQVLVVSDKALSLNFPIEYERLLSRQGGQIAGASGTAANKVLRMYGITRSLSSEGGRTSRGSVNYVKGYTDLLNNISSKGLLGTTQQERTEVLREIVVFWVDQVKEFFNAQPIIISFDLAQSVGQIVSSVIEAAQKRQTELGGEMIVGIVLQHLIGAKLSLSLPNVDVIHHCASTSDEQGGRAGDFLIHDSVIHVTAAPTEKLVSKCTDNIKHNLRPIIICPFRRVETARGLAENVGLASRIEVFDAQSFISMNLNEISTFSTSSLNVTSKRFVDKYNELITEYEDNPSLCLRVK